MVLDYSRNHKYLCRASSFIDIMRDSKSFSHEHVKRNKSKAQPAVRILWPRSEHKLLIKVYVINRIKKKMNTLKVD